MTCDHASFGCQCTLAQFTDLPFIVGALLHIPIAPVSSVDIQFSRMSDRLSTDEDRADYPYHRSFVSKRLHDLHRYTSTLNEFKREYLEAPKLSASILNAFCHPRSYPTPRVVALSASIFAIYLRFVQDDL